MDDYQFSSTTFELIPNEIQKFGSKKIIEYIINLSKSSRSGPIYKTKLFTLGSAGVGKTRLLDSLFPLAATISSPKRLFGFFSDKYYYTLQGNYLHKYANSTSQEFIQEIELNYDWRIYYSSDSDLVKLSQISGQKTTLELVFEDNQVKNNWIKRISRIIQFPSTPSKPIEIREVVVDHSFHEVLEDKKLEISVWDFGGEAHNYVSLRHFFSLGTIFLIVINISKKEEAFKDLQFWLKSLQIYLPATNTKEVSNLFSILVVGTFFDKDHLPNGKYQAIETAKSIQFPYQINYIEVSCKTLENIFQLQKLIISTTLSHSYLEEIHPETYFVVQLAILKLRENHQDFPVIAFEHFVNFCHTFSSLEFDFPLVKKALEFFTLRGDCLYYECPLESSSMVIVSPQFFSNQVIAPIFHPKFSSLYQNGILHHSNLIKIWPKFIRRAPILLNLLQHCQVCFQLNENLAKDFGTIFPKVQTDLDNDQYNLNGTFIEENVNQEIQKDEEKNFEQINLALQQFYSKSTLFPNFLSDQTPTELSTYWPNESTLIDIQKSLQFSVISKGLITRLIVHFHQEIFKGLIWRKGMLLMKDTCFILFNFEGNVLSIRARGEDKNKGSNILNHLMFEILRIVEKYYPGILLTR